MLKFLHHLVSERKRRLFAAACCRRAWHLLGDRRSRDAVEAAERYADGRAGGEELDRAEEVAHEPFIAARDAGRDAERLAAHAAYCAACADVGWDIAGAAASRVAGALGGGERGDDGAAAAGEVSAQFGLLRCVFGNPFRPVAVAPAWRTPAIVALARAASAERHLPSGHLDAAGLLVLADALEEAGATDARLLGHLRSAGPHVRGCHAVDAVLALG
jgi:hypothetical protein